MATQQLSIEQIATKLVDYCRKGEWEKAQKELYADDVISIEPYATEDFAIETKGLKAIIEKGHKFQGLVVEMHSLEVSEPLTASNSIAFVMTMDVTMKKHGRMKMPEICVYDVKDGKIVSEQFHI